jgi:hypothetical protein
MLGHANGAVGRAVKAIAVALVAEAQAEDPSAAPPAKTGLFRLRK